MVTRSPDPLIESLLQPASMAKWSLRDWDGLLPRARAAQLLPRLAKLADREDLLNRLPENISRHLATGLELAREQERSLQWELHRLEQVLSPVSCPILLLKGAAYVAAGLPMAEGRLVGDIDIMVPLEALERVEQGLLRAGWDFDEVDEYDRRYYLQWMHELPPLRHKDRKTVLDVHHAILPRTGRLKPDSSLLWAAAQRLSGSPYLVLSPPDMLLHSAAHLFQDGDLHVRLRDLFDLHEMLIRFGRTPEFWPELFSRAKVLHLARPLYYAIRYCRVLLGTELAGDANSGLEDLGPWALARLVMDRVVPGALIPPIGRAGPARHSAALFLYMRSHWLRMPPPLLAAHLMRKSFKRFREAQLTG